GFIFPESTADRCRWISTTCLLVTVAAAIVSMLFLSDDVIQIRGRFAFSVIVPALASLLLLIAAAFGLGRPERRAPCVTLVTCCFVLFSLYPIAEWTPLHTILWAYGAGYWMLLSGVLLLGGGSILQLRSSR